MTRQWAGRPTYMYPRLKTLAQSCQKDEYIVTTPRCYYESKPHKHEITAMAEVVCTELGVAPMGTNQDNEASLADRRNPTVSHKDKQTAQVIFIVFNSILTGGAPEGRIDQKQCALLVALLLAS